MSCSTRSLMPNPPHALFLAIAAGTLVALALTGYTRRPPGVLEGSSLILRGDDGTVYAEITQTDAAGAVLSLRDGLGNVRIRLQVRSDGTPFIVAADAKGRDRIELSFLDEATPRLVLRDGRSTERAKLLLMPDGSPIFYLKDKTGSKRVELAHLWTGLGGLMIFDDDQRLRALVAATPDEGHALVLFGSDGQVRLRLGVDADGDLVVRGVGAEGTEASRLRREDEGTE